jgi:hypothetical protein
MTLRPSALLPPPPPTLSSNASAAQVVFVAVPRATRTMQRFVMGEKYFTLFSVNKKRERIETLQEKEEEKKYLTRERRTDFSPADISKVQQHALLQRVKNIFTGYHIW